MSLEDAQDCDRAVVELRALNGDFSSNCQRRTGGVGRSTAGQGKQVEVKVVAVDMRFGRTIEQCLLYAGPNGRTGRHDKPQTISQEWVG
jgi:hypothetical protein